MTRRGSTLLVGAVVGVLLSVIALQLPVPYVVMTPGPTANTLGAYQGKQVISVSARNRTASKGHLDLTTVAVLDHIDMVTAVRGWFDARYAVVPRELFYPPGQSSRAVEQQNAEDFRQSQDASQVAALRELGYPVQVVVDTVPSGSPSAGVLRPGDQITGIDGGAVTTQDKLVALVTRRKPGAVLTISYVRSGRPASARVHTKAAPGETDRAIIGVRVKQRQPHPFTISFDINRIGGPSAGLMFALGILDLVKAEDLTGGRFIAGTGAIDDEGNVAPIGGIQQKLIGARRAGATIFLVPAGNCADAVPATPKGLRLVKVASLDDALRSLRLLRAGRSGIPSCTA